MSARAAGLGGACRSWSSRTGGFGGGWGVYQPQILGHPHGGYGQDEQAGQDEAAA
jgi:hypothetical protein